MTSEKITEIIRLHALGQLGKKGGKCANFAGADLTGADLTNAELAGADLTNADLTDARLTNVNLIEANLTGANLSRADLTNADIINASLVDANLTRANLTGAVLTGANLAGADLTGAKFTALNLYLANFVDANLTDADFTGADFYNADFTGVDLRAANLAEIKADLIAAILYLPRAIPFLRQAILDGRVDSTLYDDDSAHLAGTMAHACNMSWDEFKAKGLMPIDGNSPRESWFLAIRPGDTPATNQIAAITLEWIDELLATRTHDE